MIIRFDVCLKLIIINIHYLLITAFLMEVKSTKVFLMRKLILFDCKLTALLVSTTEIAGACASPVMSGTKL